MGSASDVEIRLVPEIKRRRVFASKRFSPGDVVFCESPLVSSQFVWNRTCKYDSCDFCLRPLETAEENARRLTANQALVLPFMQCCTTRKEEHRSCASCQVRYCSEACQLEALARYHRVICAISCSQRELSEQLLDTWKKLHYPPETTSVTLVLRIFATVVQASDKEAVVTRFMDFSGGMSAAEEDLLLEKLFGKQSLEAVESLRQIIASIFAAETSVTHWTTPAGFRSLLAMVARMGQAIGTSALSVWVRNCDELNLPEPDATNLNAATDKLYDDINKESGTFLNNEGSGLYSLQSLCSHSCSPNAESAFPHNNHILAMTAVKEIASGEEITVSYLDECSLNRSRHTRRKLLMENFFLSCECQRCREEVDQPDVTSDEEMEDDSSEDEC
ncbi:histone-lysine N-trimethyltransferase SMYD5-like [Ornithodoros turicata]|uniref:histone-lysine N-trimethyltransferase SMYD5-like n=1 Tax=Ornithodoros turicata TaxID=34597 RepID=UPI0031388194